MRTPFRYGNRLFTLAGQLLIFPALKDFIADIFGYGWDRNRAIDSKGAHGNALMGGYLLAASNTVIAITGILTTDTIVPLTSGGNVGTVTVNGTISFSVGNKYGAFEVYRGTTRIGRYCLTERQGLQIINQVTGGLQNGLLGGTTTTVWQRSNAFYCETNHTGYSISGTGWVTSAGVALTVGTIIPADPLNTTKCMAWVSGVQQDLQYVGKAKNSVSIVPIAFYCNADRYWQVLKNYGGTFSQHSIRFIGILNPTSVGLIYASDFVTTGASTRAMYQASANNLVSMIYPNYTVGVSITRFIGRPVEIFGEYRDSSITIRCTDLLTGDYEEATLTGLPATLTVTTAWSRAGNNIKGYYGRITEEVNNAVICDVVPDQHSTSFICLKQKLFKTITGITTNIYQNVDVIHNIYFQTGYELWINGGLYQIYLLASDGTRLKTPAGYKLDETVTAGNMPSIADSRMSTFKYTLANSCVLRNSVPEAFDATDPCAPRLLTYSELSALSANTKVIKTEADGKITNLKIK